MNSAHVSGPSYNLTAIHGLILDTGHSLTHTTSVVPESVSIQVKREDVQDRVGVVRL